MIYVLCVLLLLLKGSIAEQLEKINYTGPVIGNTISSGQRYGDIVLGGLFPIHQNENGKCGQILDLGLQRQEAMVFAIQRINSDQVLLPNLTLGFEIRDTCVNQDIALQHSLYFLNVDVGGRARQGKGISGVIGAASSQVSIYVANLLRLFQIPQISYASTARVLSDKSRYEYFFRTVPPDSQQARAIADLIYHHNWTYVSMIHTEGAYGRDGTDALKDELNIHNNHSNVTFCTAADIELSIEATTLEYDEAINMLVDNEYTSNATVVVIFGQLVTAEGILDAFERKRKLNPKLLADKCITWIASDAWGDQIDPKYYPNAHGMISIIPKKQPYPEFDDYFLSLNPKNNKHNPWFAEYWEKQFNCSLKNNRSNLRRCNTENQKLGRNYKQNSKVPFTIDAVYAFAYAIQKLTKKCLEPLCREIIDSANTIYGDKLLAELREVRFTSQTTNSASLQFDQDGDVQSEGYGIFNLQLQKGRGSNYSYVKVGSWQVTTGLKLDSDARIEWNHNYTIPLSICSKDCGYGKHPTAIEDQSKCCWNCADCSEKEVSNGTSCVRCAIGYTPNQQRNKCTMIPPTYLTWDTAWAIITIILCFVGLATTTSIAVLFYVKRNTVVVRRSSHGLSAVLLTGLLLCYIIPMFYISRPSTAICGIQQFTLGIGFSVCYSSILIKTNLLFRIFESKQLQTKNIPLISTKSQLLLTMLLIVIQCAISGIWVLIVPPSTKYTYSENTVELTCAESSSYRNIIVALAYNGILLITSTVYALRGRNIPDNYNEAKYINGTLIITCIIWLVYIPTTIVTVPQGAIYQIGSHIMAIILSATTILAALFFPKVYQIFFTDDQDNPTAMLLGTQHRQSMSHSLSHIIQQRSNESLKSGASSLCSVYQGNDKKGLGDTASKSTTSKPVNATAISTRRSSVTSIKSFTAMLPAVLEAVESEPGSSESRSASSHDSSSAINIKLESSFENTSIKGNERSFAENSSTTFENEKKQYSRENGDIDMESADHYLSIPSIQINKSPDATEPVYAARYQRRMSKSCDQLDVKIKTTSSSKWKSWSDFLSSINNSISRVKRGLSSSISHVDHSVDTLNEEAADNQNDNTPEETQLVDNHSKRTAENDKDIDAIEPAYPTKFQRRMSKSCDQLDVSITNMNENITNTNKKKYKSWSNLLSSIKRNNSIGKIKHGSSINNVDNSDDILTDQLASNQIDNTPDEIQLVDNNHSEITPEDIQDQINLAE